MIHYVDPSGLAQNYLEVLRHAGYDTKNAKYYQDWANPVACVKAGDRIVLLPEEILTELYRRHAEYNKKYRESRRERARLVKVMKDAL